MNESSTYFTVDFEDFTHDFCRARGSFKRPKFRFLELRLAYEKISYLLKKYQTNNKITFFCTGITARDYPEIIKKISNDGHEIACHNYFHDDIDKMSKKELRYFLKKAKTTLEDVSQQNVVGFRAPRFSLNKNDTDRLRVISEIFTYDSSLHFSSNIEFKLWHKNLPFKFDEFPVPCHPLAFNRLKFKTGGSYFKLFPLSLLKDIMSTSVKNNITPILYFHPYDIYSGFGFLANWNELEGIPFMSRLYSFVRQVQWAGAFNWSIDKKLKIIFNEYHNIGLLRDICNKKSNS